MGKLNRKAVAIDDTKMVRTLIEHALQVAGFETKIAADGYTGWQLIERYEPDLIVTDLDMPTWGGWQLIEAVRSTHNPRLEQTPIIVCSATDDPLSIREAFDAGATYFLAKPIDVRELSKLFEIIVSSAEFNMRSR